jgi:hypothetical protein
MSPLVALAADLDNDGFNDLIAGGYGIVVLRNRGDGTFTPPVSYDDNTVVGLAVGDFDHDGRLDIATANAPRGSVSIFHNIGAAAFGAPVTIDTGYNSATSIVAADLDGDGFDDLAVANPYDGDVRMLRNNRDGSFAPPVRVRGVADSNWITAADFDGDGDIDLAIASPTHESIAILRNDGHAIFAPPVEWNASFSQGRLSRDWLRGTSTATDGRISPSYRLTTLIASQSSSTNPCAQ